MIAKPPVICRTGIRARPFLLPETLFRESSGETLSENAVGFTLEKRLLSQRIFRKHHAREAFNCDYFRTILSGEA